MDKSIQIRKKRLREKESCKSRHPDPKVCVCMWEGGPTRVCVVVAAVFKEREI